MKDGRGQAFERTKAQGNENVHMARGMMHRVLGPKQADLMGEAVLPIIDEVSGQ